MHVIAHDLEPKQAEAERQSLVAALEAHEEGSMHLDISDGPPTQIAVQLCFSAMSEAAARNIDIAPGPAFQSLLALRATKDSKAA